MADFEEIRRRGPVAKLPQVLFLMAAGAALLLIYWFTFPSQHRRHGERKTESTGREFLAETEVEPRPNDSATAPGWDRERVWSGHDDWEPYVAADRSSSYVYQMTTRFNAHLSGIFIRRSANGGATWLPDHLVAPIDEWQADPQVQVADSGTVFVVWLHGPNWTSRLIKSTDHGETWSEPVTIAPTLRWTDHPWILVSPDGQDVYVGLNQDDSYLVSSHDGGQSFGLPIKTSTTPGHWWDHNGGAIAPDGTVYFVVINFFLNYRGASEINLISSRDKGESWQVTLIDSSAPPPGCVSSQNCEYGFLSATASLAVDQAGKILVAYHAGDVNKQPEPMWVKTSTDGVHWTPRVQISQNDPRASNGFPGAAAGPTAGDFRVVWQGNADGNPDGWNTYYRQSTDGGLTWQETRQLSDRASGAPYKTPEGYLFPFGDYLGISVDGKGTNHVIWGEGLSYEGPGGCWYTRGR